MSEKWKEKRMDESCYLDCLNHNCDPYQGQKKASHLLIRVLLVTPK